VRNEKDFLKSIGQRLKEIRLKKGLTLEDIEELGFPSWRHLQKLESGKNFTMVTLFRLCEAYDISPNEFFKNL